MIKITLKTKLLSEINELERTKEYYDTLSKYQFERIINHTDENLFLNLIGDKDKFKSLCLNKFRQIDKWYYFKPLLTLADNVFDDENDGALLDDILIRLGGIPISKYFYDRHWALNINVEKNLDKCIKLLANRLTEEMYNVLGEDFFKIFEKKGYSIFIDKNYCNSNFHISKVNYRYSDTGHNSNFSKIHFESLVVRIDKVALIRERFKENTYVMEFHKRRYNLGS